MRKPALLLFFIVPTVFAWLAGCGGPSTATMENLNRFNYDVARFDPDYRLTADELYKIIFYSKYEREGGVVDEATIKEILDSVLVDTLCGLEARKFNLRDNWLQHFVYLTQINDRLNTAYWEDIIRPQITWDTAEVIQYYNDHPDEFHVDQQINLYHIFVSPRGWDKGPDSLKMRTYTREQLWELAEEYAYNIYRVLNYGEPFQNAAFVLSHDSQTRTKGGFVGWTKRGVFEAPFDSVAFSLKPYEYSKPYKDQHGWHIIYNEGMVDEGTAPIDTLSVFVSARQGLTGSKYARRELEIMDSLRATLNIVVNPVVLDTNIYKVDDSIWAGVVNGTDTVSSRELKMFEEGFRRKYRVDSTTSDMRREMITAAADRYLAIQAARAHGIDTLPDQASYREHIWHSKCKMLVLSGCKDPDWEPTDSMKEQYYNDHILDYQKPKPLEAEHLKVLGTTEADSSLAEFLAEQVRTGVDMPSLKKEYGDTQGYKINYQKPTWVGQEDVDNMYFAVASRAVPKVGALVAKTPTAYYVIRVVENYRPVLYPQVRGQIRTKLKEQHERAIYHAFRDSLFEQYDVAFPGKLKGAQVPMLIEGRLERPAEEE